jgi:hypothetical protein
MEIAPRKSPIYCLCVPTPPCSDCSLLPSRSPNKRVKLLIYVDLEACLGARLAAGRPGAAKTPIDLSKSLSRSIRVHFDHCLEDGDSGLSRWSAKSMKRKRKVSELRSSDDCSGPHVSELTPPGANELLRLQTVSGGVRLEFVDICIIRTTTRRLECQRSQA